MGVIGSDNQACQFAAFNAMPSFTDFRFTDRLRVRWAEVDLQKIVFNGHDLMYADTAVAGYWRALALPYAATMAALGGDLYVRKATVEYLGSARYDDLLDVGIRTERIGNSSMMLAFGIFRAQQLLVSGELVYVFANPETQTSLPVPQALRELLLGYEAGQAMVELRVGEGATLREPANAIRHQVLVQELGVPQAMAWDESDASAAHAEAFNRLGFALASGRVLLDHSPGVAMIGRVAVLAVLRGSGIGAQVVGALVQAARERGQREVRLHAQTSAAAFYRRLGFSACGPAFDEAGIAHLPMARAL